MKAPLSQAGVFLVLTFLVSGFFQYRFIFHGGIEANRHLIPWLMGSPGLLGMACSLAFGHKLRDIGFRRFRIRDFALAYGLPVFAAVAIFGLLLLFGIDSFAMPSKGRIYKLLVLAPTVGFFLAFLRAIGEEIGWRGFLHSRIVAAKVPYPYVFIGIIWGAWHLPAILFADYATSSLPWMSAIFFMIGIVGGSIFAGYQRERTQSVWLAGVMHAAHNVWIQKIYPGFLAAGPLDQYFGGESGLFLTLIYGGLGLAIIQKRIKNGP